MSTRSNPAGRSWVLDDLAQAQDELVDSLARALRRVREAKLALAGAAAAGLGPETVCFTDEDGNQVTVEQLRELLKGLEADEVRARDLIAANGAKAVPPPESG